MLCEMCGKEAELTSRTRIEGSTLLLCADCSKYGVVVSPPPPAVSLGRPNRPIGGGGGGPRSASRRAEERDVYQEMPELELAPDWGRRLRVAREMRAWTPEDLAKKLNEKKSVVLKLESGSFHPPDSLVRKLEHTLGVRLRADPEPSLK
ncbi:MAG: helix-turn-helix domain-containing protein [Thermoplasmata archaeon]